MTQGTPGSPTPLLEILDLARHFPTRNAFGRRTGWLRAVDGVSLSVWPGETLGLVGESGCGKSTLGKTVMGIYAPTAGEIRFLGREIGRLRGRERRKVRARSPVRLPGSRRVARPALEDRPLAARAAPDPHAPARGRARGQQVQEILRAVGLPDAHLDLYPHELSGGQQRRVGLARILTLTAAADHPRRADLGARRVRAGERAQVVPPPAGDLRPHLSLHLPRPRGRARDVPPGRGHVPRQDRRGRARRPGSSRRRAIPYTRSLLAAVPRIGERRVTEDFSLEGEPPNPRDIPSGCRFRTRCPLVQDVCAAEEPPLRAVDGRLVACHFA